MDFNNVPFFRHKVPQSNEGSEVQVQELIEEMNHDTITSLHNFVESAQYVKSRTGHNGTFPHNLVWFEIHFMNLKKLFFLISLVQSIFSY